MILVEHYPTHGWSPRRTATGDPRVPVPEPSNGIEWRDCPTCWGQGRLYSMGLDSYEACWTCLGLGQTARLVK